MDAPTKTHRRSRSIPENRQERNNIVEGKDKVRFAREGDGFITDDGFDNIMKLERAYVDGKLRKMEANLDKRFHEMTSRLRIEISNELLQQVLVSDSAMSKKLETTHTNFEKQISKAVELTHGAFEEASKRFEDGLAGQAQALCKAKGDLADMCREVQSLRCDFASSVDDCNEQKCIIAKVQEQLSSQDNAEQKILIANILDQLNSSSKQLAEGQGEQKCIIATMQDQLGSTKRALECTVSEYLPRLEQKLAEQEDLINNVLSQPNKHEAQELDAPKQSAQLANPDSLAASELPCSSQVDTIDEATTSQELHLKQAQLSIGLLQIDVNALKVELFAESSRRADLSHEVEGLRTSVQTEQASENVDATCNASTTAAFSLRLEAVEEQMEQARVAASFDDVSAVEPAEGPQCYDISDVSTSADCVRRDAFTILRTSVEAMQGDLERLDHELTAERLDRIGCIAAVSDKVHDLRKVVEISGGRIETLEEITQAKCVDISAPKASTPKQGTFAERPTTPEQCPETPKKSDSCMFNVAEEMVAEEVRIDAVATAPADIHTARPLSQSYYQHADSDPRLPFAARPQVAAVPHMTPLASPTQIFFTPLASPEPCKPDHSHFSIEDIATPLSAGSPSRRARRGRKANQLASSPQRPRCLSKDDQEPEEVRQFLAATSVPVSLLEEFSCN